MVHTKEAIQKERLLNNLSSDWISMTNVAEKSGLLYYRAIELLEILKAEGKVEDKFNARYRYWRKKVNA